MSETMAMCSAGSVSGPPSSGFREKSSFPGATTFPPTDRAVAPYSLCQSSIITGSPASAACFTMAAAVVDFPEPVIPRTLTCLRRSSSCSLISWYSLPPDFSDPRRSPSCPDSAALGM